MASLIIDIVLALICLIIIIRNAARGFIRSFMAFARTILAILLAIVLNAPLASLFSEKIFLGLSQGWVYNAFVSTSDGNGAYQLYTLFDGIPEWFANALLRSGLDESAIQQYFYSGQSAPIEVVEKLSASLGEQLSSLISTIISMIIIFIVVEIILLFVGMLLNKVGKIPIFRFLNIMLGAIIGFIFSAVIALLAATVIIWIIQYCAVYNPEVFSHSLIEKSLILNFFNENNVWQIIKNIIMGQ